MSVPRSPKPSVIDTPSDSTNSHHDAVPQSEIRSANLQRPSLHGDGQSSPHTSHMSEGRRQSATAVKSGRPKMGVEDKKLSDDAGDLTLNAAQQLAETTGNGAYLQKLRDAVNAQIALNQQRAMLASRSSTGSIRRIASIKQEVVGTQKSSPTAMSPTLASAFDSPSLSASSESTESVRTLKGSAAQTPSGAALRTPSYPFPYVPGTPRTWSSSFHRPFTTLSPTVSIGHQRDNDNVTDTQSSGYSTPTASAFMFMPPGRHGHSSEGSEDLSYKTPNLYDLVLTLNLEPGLDAWWSTVNKIFQEHYAADRMSLALPADAGEIENVPWGQKATFAQAGRPTTAVKEPIPEPTSKSSIQVQKNAKSMRANLNSIKTESESAKRGQSQNTRPGLPARHSYAGFEAPAEITSHSSIATNLSMQAPSGRPSPLRTKSHAPHLLNRPDALSHVIESKKSVSPVISDRQFSSISGTDFSTIFSEAPRGPFAQVLPVLRALNYETEALLEASSVNRIIERGKLVVLTRDYMPSTTEAGRKTVVRFDETSEQDVSFTSKPIIASSRLGEPSRGGLKPKRSDPEGSNKSSPQKSTLYEDYEQMPSSPWSQSPAPSPAIQANPEHNPFDSMVDEDSFAPPETVVDYSHAGTVEAIGVDKANTVIHVPLIHPRVPSSFPFRASAQHPLESASPWEAIEGRTSPLKRAPIAILSFSASAVPYPPNLTQSLQLLAPHLAATYEIAQQYTSAFTQLDQQRRGRSYDIGRRIGSMNDFVDADIDASNDSTSLTSPSDYSGQSRLSPGGSLRIETPGWEHGPLGFAPTGQGTPGQDSVESYFDSRKRSQSNTSLATQLRPLDSPEIQNDDPTRGHRKRSVDEKSKKITPRSDQDSRSRRQHSLLHSYGAEFSTTLQALPSASSQNAGLLAGLEADLDLELPVHDMAPPSERLLRIIADALPVQIFVAEPGTGKVSWVNTKFICYRSQAPQEILADPWLAVHHEDRPAYMEEWRRSLNTGQQFSHKVRLERFDGAYRCFYVRATALRNKKQQIVHWAGTYMDIHEQHIAEVRAAKQQETAASEAKYKTLANSSPQIVFVVSRTRGLTFCNSQWTIYSGQSEVDASGSGFMDAVHPEDLAKCRIPSVNDDGTLQTDAPLSTPLSPGGTVTKESDASSESSKTVTTPGAGPSDSTPQARLIGLADTGILKISRDRDGRPSYSTEVRLRANDNKYRWHLVRILLSQSKEDEDDEVWYGTCTDIDDHKALELQLKDAMDAKSRFLSNMSHEIRTPLNGITGMVNFLMDSNLNTEQMEHVNIIRNSTEGLRDLINDILDLSKVEAGMIKLNMDWMHIRSLIEEVNDIMFALAMDKGLELNYSVENSVPSMVKGDRFRMRQVLLNVVGNAIKFTAKGEVFVRCEALQDRTGLKSNEAFLRFQVIDTGAGFTEKESEHLFKRFSQINKKSETGTGLGLAISMQLVELHGGRMTATSVPGQGSTFTFTIKTTQPSSISRPDITDTFSDHMIELANAAMVPTPKPLTETSQGVRFVMPKVFEDKSPVHSPPPALTTVSTTSSDGSNRSLVTGNSSIRSTRSSVSSMMSEIAARNVPAINLELPDKMRENRSRFAATASQSSSSDSVTTVKGDDLSKAAVPPGFHQSIFSILVICALVHTREAIIKHIELAIPKTAPHHITSRASFDDCQELLLGGDAARFTHIVIDLPDVEDVLTLMNQIMKLPAHANTCIVMVTDIRQRRAIGQSLHFDFEQLSKDRRIRLIFKPMKPSKMAAVFDPKMETDLATDQNQHSAQAVAVTQKQVFEDLKNRLGDTGLRILLVEDNKTSQTVLIRFFKRVSIELECVMDGGQCTEKVFASPPGYFSLILCDLQMPVKDGYQSCKEIRRWERRNKYTHVPIIALSANVLDDVYAKCVEAGFNSYVTKPVDFKELRDGLLKFLDIPESQKGKSPEFMKSKV